MKVFLIQPPVWGIFDPPTGLTQISACLKANKKNVKVIDLNIELYRKLKRESAYLWAIENSSFWTDAERVSNFFSKNLNIVKSILNKFNFDNSIVGFSVSSCSFYSSKFLARMLKKSFKNIFIVFGGPMFIVDYNAKAIFDDGVVDFVVNSEGEVTFVELVDILAHNANLKDCKGITYKEGDTIIRNEEREYIKNLDDLPFLDFEDIDFDKYDPPGHLGRHISLMTSRGCIMNCVFCGPKGYWKGYRTMTGKRIYEEIYYHIKNHPDIEHIEFLDLLFNGKLEVLEEFVELMIKNLPKKNLKWHANMVIRGDMSKDLFRKLKQAGCEHITYGIESGSQRVLDLMRKKYKIEDADRILKYTHESGIKVTCNFMFGFPGETEEDFEKTLNFLRRNARNIDVAYPSRTYCTIEPHSYMAEHLDEFNIIPSEVHGQFWESKDGKNTYLLRLSRAERFSKLAISLGVDIGLGLQTSIDQDKFFNIARYYEIKNDLEKAVFYYQKYLKLNPNDFEVLRKLEKLSNLL